MTTDAADITEQMMRAKQQRRRIVGGWADADPPQPARGQVGALAAALRATEPALSASTANWSAGELVSSSVLNAPISARDILIARLVALTDPVLWLTAGAAVFAAMQPGIRWTALLPVGIYAALQYLASHGNSSALQLQLRSVGKISGGQ